MSESLILAAKNIRAELKMKFPATKFSVRSRTYAGGNHVSIVWEDGPEAEAVQSITGKYEQGAFNGVTDSYEYDNDSQRKECRRIRGSAKYVMLQRRRRRAG